MHARKMQAQHGTAELVFDAQAESRSLQHDELSARCTCPASTTNVLSWLSEVAKSGLKEPTRPLGL